MASGVVGPWWLQGQKDESEKKRRHAEKFEELVQAIFEHEHWLDVYRNEKLYGQNADIGMSPIAKALTIAAVYFRSLNKTVRELDMAATQFGMWILKERQKATCEGTMGRERR